MHLAKNRDDLRESYDMRNDLAESVVWLKKQYPHLAESDIHPCCVKVFKAILESPRSQEIPQSERSLWVRTVLLRGLASYLRTNSHDVPDIS